MNIEEFKKQVAKQYGQDAIMEIGEARELDLQTLPTGIPSLDVVLGNRGLARGRIVEIYGPESAGKTALVSFIVAQAQHMAGQEPQIIGNPPDTKPKPVSGRIGFVDVEHTFSPEFAHQLGVNVGADSKFYISQPSSGDQALSEIQMMVESGLFDYVILDSVAGLLSEAEEQADYGNRQIAQIANMMSTAMRKLTAQIYKSRTIVIFINQIREKPAVQYGSPETTPGGRALKFSASYRMRVARAGQIKSGSRVIGHIMKISVNKNKLSAPYKSTEVKFYYETLGEPGSKDYHPVGFDIWEDTIAAAKALGVVTLRGSTYTYADKETGEILAKGQGAVAFQSVLDSSPELKAKLIKDVQEA